MLIEVERLGDDSPPTHRQLVATGRWERPVLIVDYDPHTRSWRVVGETHDRGSARELEARERILSAVPGEPPGATEDQLAGLTDLDKRKVSGPLRKLVGDGVVIRTGEGKPYRPFYYWRNSAPNSAPGGAELALKVRPLPEGGRTQPTTLP
jgi:hypothetical protein